MCVCVCVCVCAHACARVLRHVQLFETPWTIGHQALLSVEFSRQGYLERVAISYPSGPSCPRIEPESPAPIDGFFSAAPPGKPIGVQWAASQVGQARLARSL